LPSTVLCPAARCTSPVPHGHLLHIFLNRSDSAS
jgi:hypothetical protein